MGFRTYGLGLRTVAWRDGCQAFRHLGTEEDLGTVTIQG